MNIKQVIRNWLKDERSDGGTLGNPGFLFETWGALPTDAGVPISERSSVSLSAVWTCVNIRAGLIASLPLKVYQRQDNGRRLARDVREYRILHDQASKEDTAYNFRHKLMGNLLLWGNAYAVITTDGRGMVNGLWPYHPGQVRIHYGDTRGDYHYLVSGQMGDGFVQVKVQPENMLHLRGFCFDRLEGLSVIQNYRRGLGLAVATEVFGSSFYKNGARASGVLEYPGKLSQTAHDRLKHDFAEKYAGSYNAGGIPVLEEGTKYTQLSINQNDAQFLETRQLGRAEIAGLFRIPTMMLPGSDSKPATYASSEIFNRQLLDFTLRDDLTMWQNELNSKLFPNGDYYCEFDLRDLLRGDTAARAAYWKARWEMGSISADEIREDENENPLPDGDGKKYFVPLNYRDVSEPIPAANPAPSPALPAPKPPQSKAGMKKLFSNIVKEIRDWKEFSEKRATNKFKGSLVEPLAAELNCESEKVIEYCSQALAARALTIQDEMLDSELSWLANQLETHETQTQA